MLRVDPSLNHIPARREHVVSLYESINQPLVNIPSHGTAPTGAYLLGTRNEHGYYTVFVYLHQAETRAVIIYVSEPRSLTADQFRVEESEAIRFVESMGFMIDSVHFRRLAAPEQDAVMSRVQIFRPAQPTMDLYEEIREEAAQERRGVPADPLFGSVGPGAADVFRRAGIGAGQTIGPATPSIGPVPGPFAGAPSPMSGITGIPASMPGNMSGLPGNASGLPSPMPGRPSAWEGARGLAGGPVGMAGGPAATPSTLTGIGDTVSGAQVTLGAHPGMIPQYPGSGPPIGPQGSQPPVYGGALASTTTGSLAIPPSSSMQIPLSGAQSSPARDSQETSEALQRLGRLLAAFSILLAAGAGAFACKSAEAPVGNRVQSEVDVGTQHLAQQHWADAITSFSEALKEDPNEREALRGSGFAYWSLGRLDDAERFYRRAIQADPKWSFPKNELAVVLTQTKQSARCEEAEQLLRGVLEDIFYPTPEFADHNLAKALACEGKVGEAVTRLETLVTKRPYFCLGYLTLAELSSQAKRPELTVKACEDFDHYCAKNEKIRSQVAPEQSALCYFNSGKAYVEMGDVESARASFQRCQSSNDALGKECKQSLQLLPN